MQATQNEDRVPMEGRGWPSLRCMSALGLGNGQRTQVVSEFSSLLLTSAPDPLPLTQGAFFFLLLDESTA